jgi:hypothetical protein
MTKVPISDQRARSIHLRSQAEIRLVQSMDGPTTGARLLEVRAPTGIALDIALDRGGDIHRLSFRGVEIGWHGAADGITPWPALDSEEGLGFLRGFDGFLVTCGLDHHGVATRTSADHFLYPLRHNNHHPLHGRIMAQKAELVHKSIDWQDAQISVSLIVRQASVFGEVLELVRTYRISLESPEIEIVDAVRNCGFRPVRHGILYHFNIGYPMLDANARLIGNGWKLADKLDPTGAVPSDDHVEIVDAGGSPEGGTVGITNTSLGLELSMEFDPKKLPVTALWRAFQSGVFALGLEPQTAWNDPDNETLSPQETRIYGIKLRLQIR